MLFIARFTDQPNSQHVRRLHQESHEAYVANNRDSILVAGPLRRDDLGNAVDGLWYVDAKDRREAERLCYASPYWTAGLWGSVTLMLQQAPVNAYANVRVTCL